MAPQNITESHSDLIMIEEVERQKSEDGSL